MIRSSDRQQRGGGSSGVTVAGRDEQQRDAAPLVSAPTIAEASQRELFFSVPRDAIVSDVVTGLDLYIEIGGRYVLYRAGDQPLDRQSLEKLLRRDVESFHLRRSQSDVYTTYLGEHARTLLEQATTVPDQAEVLRSTSHSALRTAFERLDDARAYERVRIASDLTVERVAADARFLPELVQFAADRETLLTRATNTTAYAIALAARQRGLSDAEVYSIGLGAMVHDVGLATIGSALDAGTHLSEVEQRIVDRHTRRGHETLLRAGIDDSVVLDIAREHHGGMDGRMPSLHAQIVALADTFDTLTNGADHGQAVGPFAALYQMRSQIGQSYSLELLREFVLLLGGVPVPNAQSPVAPLSGRSAMQRPGLLPANVAVFADGSDEPQRRSRTSRRARNPDAQLFIE